VFSGLVRSDYKGEYWPHHIGHLHDEDALRFVENLLYLIPLGPRDEDFHVLKNTHIPPADVRSLAEAADDAWQAILNRDAAAFGDAVRHSFEAQITMFPNMINSDILNLIDIYRERALGWKLSSAGGGGYLIIVADELIASGMRIVVRREL